MAETTELKPKASRGRPATGRVRLAIRVKPRTRMRIMALIDDEMTTPGMVVDMLLEMQGMKGEA